MQKFIEEKPEVWYEDIGEALIDTNNVVPPK